MKIVMFAVFPIILLAGCTQAMAPTTTTNYPSASAPAQPAAVTTPSTTGTEYDYNGSTQAKELKK